MNVAALPRWSRYHTYYTITGISQLADPDPTVGICVCWEALHVRLRVHVHAHTPHQLWPRFWRAPCVLPSLVVERSSADILSGEW